MNETMNCPVCTEEGVARRRWSTKIDVNTEYHYDCPRCGHFIISDFLQDGELQGFPLNSAPSSVIVSGASSVPVARHHRFLEANCRELTILSRPERNRPII